MAYMSALIGHLIRKYVILISYEIFSLSKVNIIMAMQIFIKQYILIFFMKKDWYVTVREIKPELEETIESLKDCVCTCAQAHLCLCVYCIHVCTYKIYLTLRFVCS